MAENSNESSLVEMKQSNSKAGHKEKLSPSEFESEGDDETGKKPRNNHWSKDHDMCSDKKSDLPLYEFSKIGRYKNTYR